MRGFGFYLVLVIRGAISAEMSMLLTGKGLDARVFTVGAGRLVQADAAHADVAFEKTRAGVRAAAASDRVWDRPYITFAKLYGFWTRALGHELVLLLPAHALSVAIVARDEGIADARAGRGRLLGVAVVLLAHLPAGPSLGPRG